MNIRRTISTVGVAGILALGGAATAASAATVQPGDTLSGIAAANGTTVSQLVALNGISNPNALQVGENINTGGGGSNAAPAPQAAAPVVNNSAKQQVAQIESGGNPWAVNPSSGAVGEFQCLPSVQACPAAGDAAAQSAWADVYVAGRYGSWDAALAHEHSFGWY